jgi:hypothetical protein
MLHGAHKNARKGLLLALVLLVAPGSTTLLAAPVASPANACGAACPCEAREGAQSAEERAACSTADACAGDDRHGSSSEEGDAEHEECPERCPDLCSDCACCPAATNATLSHGATLKLKTVSAALFTIEEAPASAGRLGVFRPPRTPS